MASQTIKGLTVQISGDTSKLGTAIKDAEDKSKNLGRELTDVNKLLKLDPENIELLAQKQQVLAERVSATKEKLDILKEAEAQVQFQFEKGDITAEQYRAFQREIAYTANAMGGYQIAIEQTTQKLIEAKLKTGEEASSLEELKTKISLQKQELSELSNQYKEVVFSEGENSQKATELKEKYNQLSSELAESEQKLSGVETAAQSLGQAEETALSPLDSLKSTISEQEQELEELNSEYKNAVLQYGKNSDEAKALASQIKSLSDEHKTQKDKLEEAEKASKDITATEKTLTEQYKDQKSKLDDLKKQYVNAAAQYGVNSKEAKALAQQIDSLSGELAEEDKKIKEAEKSADSFDKTLDDTSQSADSTAKNVKNLDDSTGKLGTAFKDAATAVGSFMANLATELLQKSIELIKQFAVGTIETGKTFEASMSNVAALSGATSEELQQLNETARQYGRDTQYSASECADALSYMALAGWNVEDMTASLPGILNLAAASQMDLAAASDIVTDYMTGFGWEANRAGEFADRMAFAMANSNAKTEQLGEAYKNCASTANSMHYSMEEVTAAIMTMANAGVKGGEAGTAMNAIMTRLATDTKGCASSLKAYGVNIYDEQGNMQSLSNILNGISETWENLTDEQQANLAKIIAGQNQYASFQTIMQGLSDTAKENGKSFEDYTEALMNCDGAASQMAETMTDNLQGDLKKMESAYQDLQLTIYDNVNMPLRTVVQTITGEVLPAISNLATGVEGADKAVGKAVGNLVSTVLTETTELIPQFSGIIGTLAMTLVDSLPEIAQNIGKSVSVLVNGLIDALPSALPLIMQTIRQLISLVINSIGEYATNWLPAFSESIPELLSTLMNLLIQNLPIVLTQLTSALQSLVPGIITWVSQGIPAIIQAVVQFLNDGIPIILTAAVDLFNVILTAIPELIVALAETLPDVIFTIVDVLLTNIPVVLDSATTLLLSIVNALPEILTALTAALPQIVEKLIEFFTSEDNLAKVLESAFTLLSTLIDCVPDVITLLVLATADIVMAILTAIGEKIPDMAQKGSELFESLIEKSAIIIQKIVMFIPELIASITGAISNHFKDLQDAGMNMFNKIGEGFMSMISGAFDWGADLIDNFVSGVFGGENEITKAAENIGERIWEYLHFSEPEKGKLADFSTYAPDMMATFANGISQNAVLVIEQLSYLSNSMGIEAQNAGIRFIDGIQVFISTLPQNINVHFTNAINVVATFGVGMLAKAQEIGKSFIDGIQVFISTLPQNINVHLTNALNNVINFGNSLVSTASSAAATMVSAIENIVRSLPDKMASVGTNLVQGLWNGIQGMKDWVLSQISGFCDTIINGIMNSLDIHSPSRKTFYAGQMIDAGLAEGVKAYADDPSEAMRHMAANLLDEAAVIPEQLEISDNYQPPSVIQNSGLESTLSAQLSEILQAIKDGQVLVIDSNKLVGATADKMNSALGQIQLLSTRRL